MRAKAPPERLSSVLLRGPGPIDRWVLRAVASWTVVVTGAAAGLFAVSQAYRLAEALGGAGGVWARVLGLVFVTGAVWALPLGVCLAWVIVGRDMGDKGASAALFGAGVSPVRAWWTAWAFGLVAAAASWWLWQVAVPDWMGKVRTAARKAAPTLLATTGAVSWGPVWLWRPGGDEPVVAAVSGAGGTVAFVAADARWTGTGWALRDVDVYFPPAGEAAVPVAAHVDAATVAWGASLEGVVSPVMGLSADALSRCAAPACRFERARRSAMAVLFVLMLVCTWPYVWSGRSKLALAAPVACFALCHAAGRAAEVGWRSGGPLTPELAAWAVVAPVLVMVLARGAGTLYIRGGAVRRPRPQR